MPCPRMPHTLAHKRQRPNLPSTPKLRLIDPHQVVLIFRRQRRPMVHFRRGPVGLGSTAGP